MIRNVQVEMMDIRMGREGLSHICCPLAVVIGLSLEECDPELFDNFHLKTPCPILPSTQEFALAC